MDHFKLNYSRILTFVVALVLTIGSCNEKRNAVQSIDINLWNESTQNYIKLKCDPTSILQKQLIPEFAFNDSLVFDNLNQYIQYRLKFRNIIIDSIGSNTNLNNIDKIRIEEFYNNDNSTATIYLENKLEGNRRVLRITYLRNNDVKFSEVSDLSKYSMNSYDDDECLLAMEYSMITRFTIVTDFIDSGKCDTGFISLY